MSFPHLNAIAWNEIQPHVGLYVDCVGTILGKQALVGCTVVGDRRFKRHPHMMGGFSVTESLDCAQCAQWRGRDSSRGDSAQREGSCDKASPTIRKIIAPLS